MENKTITILGVTGGIGHAAATAFLAAGWRVTGFARTNRHPIEGVDFIGGDANSVSDLRRATAQSDVVLNALNLPYHQWGNGAAEALMDRVIAASSGKTMLLPGNIYNYAATDRVITPDLEQHPATYRGNIRKRMENALQQAVNVGQLRAIILRAGNFYGTRVDNNDFFGQLILRDAGKGKICLNPKRDIKNAWAYLPDLAQAFVTLAEHRDSFAAFENFHFKGHLKTANETFAAIEAAAGQKLKMTGFPWTIFAAMGVFMPVMKGIVEMRYLWDNELGLVDPRLDALLGEDFGTPYDAAIATVVAPYFAQNRLAA